MSIHCIAPHPFQLLVFGGKLHPVGGIETHLLHFCQLAKTQFAQVTLVATTQNFSPQSKITLQNAGVVVVEFDCDRSPRGMLGYLQCLLYMRRVANSKATWLYTNGTTGFAAAIFKFCHVKRWIHHHHSDVTPEMIASFPSPYRQVLVRADWLLTCTNEQSRRLGKHFKRSDCTVSVPCCKAEPATEAIGSHKLQIGAKPVIGFFGRLRESKGVKTLLNLNSWFGAHGLECRLYGDDCEGLVAGGLPANVVWHGAYMPDQDLDGLLSEISLLVLPTTFPEGLPLVIAEAISRGIPVVAFSGGGVRDLHDFHPGLLVIQPNVDALKAGILEMLSRLKNPRLSQSLIKEYQTRLSNRVCMEWWATQLKSAA